MTDELAERLLVKVLDWGPEEVRINLATIQALATWKYDSYERFSHGMRFVECLALWLEQFETAQERNIAFNFVRNRLVFLSEAEMTHLVEMAYPDFVRPYLLQRIAEEAGQPLRQPKELARQKEFLLRQRQCLFLGLSDGARTDVFRRSNSSDLTHEQILLTYEIEQGRAGKLLSALGKGLEEINGSPMAAELCKFRTAVLIDDFSGSGLSYLRTENGEYTGKIARFCKNLMKADSPTASLFAREKLEILVVLYVGTIQAKSHLDAEIVKLRQSCNAKCDAVFIHQLDGSVVIAPEQDDPMKALIEKYYDQAIEDQHTGVGGNDVKYGFARCGLPLVLPHNTPNNSLSLLWAETEKVKALFPRIQRHRKQS